MGLKTQKTFYIQNFYQDLNSLYHVGDKFILVETTRDTHDGDIVSSWSLAQDEGGIGGNLNRDIKRYHGWRGTSFGRAVYAHGLRKITRVKPVDDFTLKVTVGKDLHPDWE